MAKKPIEIVDEIFTLGSYCLIGIEDESIFDYEDSNSGFYHDEFHCVIQAESDLYQFYKKGTYEGSTVERIFELELHNGVFTVYNNKKHPIYSTFSSKNMTEKTFDELVKSIDTYLSRFDIAECEVFIDSVGREYTKEDMQKSADEVFSTFGEGLNHLTEKKFTQIKELVQTEFANSTPSTVKGIYRSLMSFYHPDRNQNTLVEANEIAQIINRLYTIYKK